MAGSIDRIQGNCDHLHHLFPHPACKQLSLRRRIAQVAFHVFTLGIPLAIYKLVHCCRVSPGAEIEQVALSALQGDSSSDALPAREGLPFPEEYYQFEEFRNWIEWLPRMINTKFDGANRLFPYDELFNGLYDANRTYPLPMTEEQRQEVAQLVDTADFTYFHPDLVQFYVHEILEIAEMPVPHSRERQWSYAIGLFRRMQEQSEEMDQRYQALIEQGIDEDKVGVFRRVMHNVKQLQLNACFNWITHYHEIYRGAFTPRAQIEIEMTSSSVYIPQYHDNLGDHPTLPQRIIWEPASGRLFARIEYYLEGEEKLKTKEIDLSIDNPEARFYAGCVWHNAPAEDDRNVIPYLEAEPEPIYQRSSDFPIGGLNATVLYSLIEALANQA